MMVAGQGRFGEHHHPWCMLGPLHKAQVWEQTKHPQLLHAPWEFTPTQESSIVMLQSLVNHKQIYEYTILWQISLI